MNRYLLKAAAAGALGGLLFGFDTAVIAGTTDQLTKVFQLTPGSLGITVSIGLFGTVLGAIAAGMLGQKIGGRDALRWMALLYLLSSVGCAFASNWPVLLVARFIGGVGIGGSSVLAPVYIAELSPAKWRGRLVGLFQINIVIGILLAYFSNYLITLAKLGALQWRWEFGVAIVPSLIFLASLFGVPRSARWLVTRDQFEEARVVIELLGSTDSDAELNAMIVSIRGEATEQHPPLFQWQNRLPIFLAVSIGLFNQLTGINAILYYSNYIFGSAGYSANSAALQTVVVGIINLVATCLGMSLIDKAGRKTLLLIGAAGMAAALSGIAFVFHSATHQNVLLWLLVGFIGFFAVSQGAVVWVYIAEVFPSHIRSKGQSLGSSSHWIMNALIAALFPIVATHSKSLPFAFFAGMMLLQFFVVLWIYPETKGRSLEAIQDALRQH